MVISVYITAAVATLLGFMTGLGLGGGSLLILWLTQIAQQDPANARTICLLFFIPSALISCLFRWKQHNIPWKKIFPAMAAGCVSALLFSWLGSWIQTDLLKKLFGGFLIITGLREICYRPRKFK